MNNETTRRNEGLENIDDKGDIGARNTSQSSRSGRAQDIDRSQNINQSQRGFSGQNRSAGMYRGAAREGDYAAQDNGMAGLWAALIGVGAGIAAMYFLDPNRGGRRRALVSDKFTSAANRLPDAMGVAARDLSNRARGVWAETTNLFTSDDPSDQVLEARVRSNMGRVVSHPSAVHVMARDGRVTLDGQILSREVPALLACVEKVRGVQSVDNRLDVHESAGNIPSLQGGGARTGEQWELMQENWSPAARIGAGTLGLALSALGATIIARSVTNTEMQRLTGAGGGRRAITVDKSINVNAPVDVLWALWSNFENFPQFMSNVLEVRNIDDRRSHWKVAGPAGIPVQWDADITKIVPNEMIAWKSVEGSTVANAGYVLFEPNDDGSTEVSVHLSYNPPAGAVGHAVAKIFGADPKTEMDQDLMRMKSLLETGKVPHDAAQHISVNPNRANRVH